jgi:hypothetical protein
MLKIWMNETDNQWLAYVSGKKKKEGVGSS